MRQGSRIFFAHATPRRHTMHIFYTCIYIPIFTELNNLQGSFINSKYFWKSVYFPRWSPQHFAKTPSKTYFI